MADGWRKQRRHSLASSVQGDVVRQPKLAQLLDLAHRQRGEGAEPHDAIRAVGWGYSHPGSNGGWGCCCCGGSSLLLVLENVSRINLSE